MVLNSAGFQIFFLCFFFFFPQLNIRWCVVPLAACFHQWVTMSEETSHRIERNYIFIYFLASLQGNWCFSDQTRLLPSFFSSASQQFCLNLKGSAAKILEDHLKRLPPRACFLLLMLLFPSLDISGLWYGFWGFIPCIASFCLINW